MRVLRLKNIASSLGICITVLLSGSAQAATFVLGADNQGWYNENGLTNERTADTATGNTFTGSFTNVSLPPFLSGEYRSFFLFDVSQLTDPIQQGILSLYQETYFSSESSETVTLFDVTTNSNGFDTSNSLSSNRSVFSDLGSGVEYGQGTVIASPTLTSAGTTSFENQYLNITLTEAAIGAINQARQGSGFFGIGVALSSLDNTPYVATAGPNGEIQASAEAVLFSSGAPQDCRGLLIVSTSSQIETSAEDTCLAGGDPLPEDPTAVPEPRLLVGTVLALGLGFSLNKRF